MEKNEKNAAYIEMRDREIKEKRLMRISDDCIRRKNTRFKLNVAERPLQISLTEETKE